MQKLRGKSGITLIALVITIIVLLILAGISISMLSGDNSILNRATETKEKSDVTGTKEKIQIAVMSAITEKNGNLEEETLKSELKKTISGITDNDITGNKEDGWQIKIEDKGYIISSKGEVNEAYWEEIKDNNGNVTEIRRIDGTVTGLKVGDTIGYKEKEGVASADFTIFSARTTNGSKDQTVNLNDYNGTWKLLGVEKGKLNLISSVIAGVPKTDGDNVSNGVWTDSYFKLAGRRGYQNGEIELNRVCSLYGKGKYAEGARSINVDDINKITGYNPNAVGIKNPTNLQITSGTKYATGKIDQYGNKVTYEWDGTADEPDKPKYTSTVENGYLTETHNWNNTKGFLWWNGSDWKKSDYTGTSGKICELTSDCYEYYPETLTTTNNIEQSVGLAHNSIERNMLFNPEQDYYWLASKCIDTYYANVNFIMRYVYSGYVNYRLLFLSCGKSMGVGVGLRPVVSLKGDIKLKKDGNNIWQFIE